MNALIAHTRRQIACLAGLVIAVTSSAGAFAQERAPAVRSAISECEAAALSGTDAARALGACDFALRDSSLGDEERARLHLNRAALSAARGDGRNAMTDLNAARALLDDLPQLHLTLSAAQIRIGDFNGAQASARRALELGLEPSHLAHFNRAIALERLGRYDDAYEAYREAARLAPDNTLLAAQPRRFARHQP
ncbi:tetratricopeptide repeat protein [Glycocaulis abyssi]|uniref:Tetratricopeptide repeat protein n=1 Tax=Glycocaulis abyssi TaxID=1433403 RepID=A0ABV9N901_9PROT